MSQPVTVPAKVTIASGVATANFGSPGVGFVWTGSISVKGAASGNVNPVTWHATAGMAPQATFYNDQASGTVQVASGDTLTLVGTNLASGSYTAYFVGVQDETKSAPSVWPGPTPAPPPGAPQQIVSNNVPLPAGPPTQIGSNQPVIVGTSLEIFECITAPFMGGLGNSIRLEIQWSIDGSFVDPVEWDMDLALGINMRGLILPNLAPFVRFLALSHGGTQISLTAFTGLPPIVRPPIVPTGVLWYEQPPLGSSTIAIPPYIGPASVEMLPNNSAGFGAEVQSFDWQGNLISESRQEQGWPAGTGPFSSGGIIFLPPLINVLNIVGAPTGAIVSGVALGP